MYIYLSIYLDIKVDTEIDIDRYTKIYAQCVYCLRLTMAWIMLNTYVFNHDEIKMVKIAFHKHEVCLFKHIDDFAFKPQYKIYHLG